MKFGEIGDLTVLTLRDPEAALRVLKGLQLPMAARWGVLLLASVLSTLLFGIERLLSDGAVPDDALPLLVVAAISFGLSVLGIVLIQRIGRAFGGTGNLDDALLAFGWIDIILVGLQVAQLLFLLIAPGSESLMLLISMALSLYLTILMTKALHGFRSTIQVVVGFFAIGMVVAMILTALALSLGLVPEMTP